MRYSRNEKMLSSDENQKLREFRVCVVGCGGLGGNVIEMLGRLGIGNITAIDGDVFDESNLNRQILSTESNMGQSKSLVAKERMKKINSDVTLNPVQDFLTEENAKDILQGHDVIIDALDNVKMRMVLQEKAKVLNTPLIHGAIAGWYGQVTTILPGDDTLTKLYGEIHTPIENPLGNPSFTPALVASIEVAETVKVLLGKGNLLRHKVLYIDTLDQDYEVIDL